MMSDAPRTPRVGWILTAIKSESWSRSGLMMLASTLCSLPAVAARFDRPDVPARPYNHGVAMAAGQLTRRAARPRVRSPPHHAGAGAHRPGGAGRGAEKASHEPPPVLWVGPPRLGVEDQTPGGNFRETFSA